MTLTVTALPYTRVSKDEMAKEGLSLPAQVAATRRYAVAQGWAIGAEFQDVMTGRRADRPQYQALLAECRRLVAQGHQVAVVVCWLHRLGRRVLESVRCREELKALGVPVHSVHEGGQVNDFLANIMASTAQYESEQIGERVKQVNGETRANGWLPVGRVAWGYRWRAATEAERKDGAPKKVLTRHPDTAPYVLEAFRRVAQGATVRAVAAWIAGLPDEARGRRRLPLACVFQVLRTPTYVGKVRVGGTLVGAKLVDGTPRGGKWVGGTLVDGKWPALVDDATWHQAHAMLAQHTTLPRQISGRHLLSGFLHCPVCGARMGGRVRRGHGNRYQCSGYTRGALAPDVRCVVTALTAPLDEAVQEAIAPLVRLAAHRELRPALRRAWKALQAPPLRGDAHSQIMRRGRTLTQARTAMKRASMALVNGVLPKDQYTVVVTQLRRDIEADETEIARLQALAGMASALPPLETVLEAAGGWGEAVARFDVASQREVLAVLVERVVPRRVGHGTYEVDITWTAAGEALRRAVEAVEAVGTGEEAGR